MADEHDQHSGGGEDGHKSGGHAGGHAKPHGGGHGGGSHEEHEGAPEWLISFADNVALMMGFFVILLAMNMAKPTLGGIGGSGKNTSDSSPEMEDFAIEVRKAFNTPVDINSTNPNEAALVRRLKQRRDEKGSTIRNPGPAGEETTAQAPRPSNWYTITATVAFPEFASELNQDGKDLMADTARSLRGQPYIIEVRGHVSAVESRDDDKSKAMQLAHDRAVSAAKALVAAGVSWNQLRIVECADNERQTPRANSAEGHQSNQRVEIVTTQEQVATDPYAGSSGPAGAATNERRPPGHSD